MVIKLFLRITIDSDKLPKYVYDSNYYYSPLLLYYNVCKMMSGCKISYSD